MRWVGPAILLVIALLVPVVAVVGPVDAQPPPPAGTVWPPGVPVDPNNPGLYDYFWDSATRAFTPVKDFVRVAPGTSVDLHIRANDVASFAVCPSQEAGVAVTMQQCRDRSLQVAAGGTCGAASEYASGAGDPVLGHQHVITLCSGVYALDSLTMISGDANAEVAPKRGAITSMSAHGTARRGVVEVTGKTLGVARAEYCMTSVPAPCRRRATIDIVVEPAGWTDARVVGVDDEYRLELDWSQQIALLRARDGGSTTPWGLVPIVGTYCCLANLDGWIFNLKLPVMFGSDRIATGRDAVVFYDSVGVEQGRMRCVPLYCDQIVPKNSAVSRWQAGAADSIGVDVEAVGKSLNVTLWGNPTDKTGIRPRSHNVVTPVISYCLAHWQQHCDASTCATATYRNAPNINRQNWMRVVPSSAYVATTICPAPAEVYIEVADVTPLTFNPQNFAFVPPTPANTPVTAPPEPPPWTYRPDPTSFSPGAADPLFWCFPGRFLDSAIGDLEGDAALWIDDPATTAVSPARTTRFGRYYNGQDADGSNVSAWPALAARAIDPVTLAVDNRDDLIRQITEREYQAILLNPAAFPDRDPTLGAAWVAAAQQIYAEFIDPAGYATNHERHYLALNPAATPPFPPPPPAPATIEQFIRDYVDSAGMWYVDYPSVSSDPLFDFVGNRDGRVFADHDVLFHNEWNREPLWQGLVRSEYQDDHGAADEGGGPLRQVDHRLLEDPSTQTRSCLAAGTTTRIVGAWATYPGAANWGDPTHSLCGFGLDSTLLPPPANPPTGPLAWHRRDADCPADALVAGTASLPQVWLRDDPSDSVYDPRLGAAWESALVGAAACHDARQCDGWAPPVPGYYQIRVRIERLPTNPFVCPPITFGEPAPSPECAYHHYLTDRTSGFLPLGWPDYWGPPPAPDNPVPTIEFDDLVWVADVRVDAVR